LQDRSRALRERAPEALGCCGILNNRTTVCCDTAKFAKAVREKISPSSMHGRCSIEWSSGISRPAQGEKLMAMTTQFAQNEPPRADIDDLTGPTLIEFGTDWCGYCRARPNR
jgi:hypothetical protein